MEPGVRLVCDRCGNRFSPGEPLGRSGDSCCSDSATTHSCLGHVHLSYDYKRLQTTLSSLVADTGDIWSYRPLLPVTGAQPVTLGEGDTDCITANRLGGELDIDLRLKLEGQLPSGSTKDRGSAVLATYAREQGHDTIACASTGNAAASIAAYTARAGLDCRLFVPTTTPQTKAVQPEIYGATVNRIDGTYATAFNACAETVANEGWLDRSAGASPFTAAGAATLGFEISADCPDADWVVMPMGNGGTLAGAWKGLFLASKLGFIEEAPRMLGVQTRAATTIHDAFHERYATSDSVKADPSNCSGEKTQADSIDVQEPHRLEEACHALAESDGTSVLVSEDAITNSIRRLGRTEGIFAEPASAAVIAGIHTARERDLIDPSETAVGVITGSGLKDAASAQAALTQAKQRYTGRRKL